MKTYLFIPLLISALIDINAAPIKSVEEGFATPWTIIKVAVGNDDGCTGIQAQEELIISRDGDQISVHGKYFETLYSNKKTSNKSRILSQDGYADLIKRLSEFYETAKKETDLNERLSSLSEEEREKELQKLYKLWGGQPIGGIGGTYFYVVFNPEKYDSVLVDGFAEEKSIKDFSSWIHATAGLNER